MNDAIMLVAGIGSRLHPLTLNVPKPMLPIAGMPINEHQIYRLKEAGITRISMATAYHGNAFSDYYGDGHLGIELIYALGPLELQTGGAIRNAASFLTDGHPDDPIIVLNGDILGDHDIKAQVAAHLAADADITLHLVHVKDPRPFGVVPTDIHGNVLEFLEKTPNPPTNQINAGCYVFRRSVINKLIAKGREVSVERETFPKALKMGLKVIGYMDESYWLDLGRPADYVRGSRDLMTGAVQSPLTFPGMRHGTSGVMPGAIVDPTALLDNGSIISAGAKIGAGAQIIGSVIMEGAVIAENAHVINSAVGVGAYVEKDMTLINSIIGDRMAIGGSGKALAEGVKVFHLPDGEIVTG
jgi:mannose-1-phosphate guanylyltransferase